MKRPLVLLGVAAAIASMASLPLSLVARYLVVPGVSADEATGSLWHGKLRAARFRALALGDLAVAVPPLPLLLGQRQLDVSAASWSARLSSGNRDGVLSFDGLLPAVPLAALHGATVHVSFRQARLLFEAGRCIEGAGSVAAVLQWPGVQLPELELAGPVECAAGIGRVTLSNGGRGSFPIQLLATVSGDGSYCLHASAQPVDQSARMALVSGGFHDTPSGLGKTVEGSLFD